MARFVAGCLLSSNTSANSAYICRISNVIQPSDQHMYASELLLASRSCEIAGRQLIYC